MTYCTFSDKIDKQNSVVSSMRVSYKKLWALCVEKEMTKSDLRKQAGISSATLTKLSKNQEVNLSILLKIAEVMNCNAGDMMDFIQDEQVMPNISVDEVW